MPYRSAVVRALGFGWAARREAGVPIRFLLWMLPAPTAGSVALAASLLALRGLVEALPGPLFLGLSALSGCAAYGATVFLVDRLQDSPLTRTLREYLPFPASLILQRAMFR